LIFRLPRFIFLLWDLDFLNQFLQAKSMNALLDPWTSPDSALFNPVIAKVDVQNIVRATRIALFGSALGSRSMQTGFLNLYLSSPCEFSSSKHSFSASSMC
jgi:hypothetical protein